MILYGIQQHGHRHIHQFYRRHPPSPGVSEEPTPANLPAPPLPEKMSLADGPSRLMLRQPPAVPRRPNSVRVNYDSPITVMLLSYY